MIQKAKQLANDIQQSSDLWDLEHYLTERRKEINHKYYYRYSQFTHVFGDFCTKDDSGRKSCAACEKTR